jgi:hypothetical protein
MTPAWIMDIFAALMLVVAAVSAARLAVALPWRRGTATADTDVAVAHLLMAIAMAGMLAPSLTTLPNTAWDVVFGLMTAWLACRVARDARASGIRALAVGHRVPHLMHSGAMLYMFLALAATQALEHPTLAFAFALILVGFSTWDLDQLSGRRYSLTSARVSPPGDFLLSPAATVGCRIVMGVTMTLMLLVMI